MYGDHRIHLIIAYQSYNKVIQLIEPHERCCRFMENYNTFLLYFQELNQRYNAILQMYGEKVEEADELRLDLNDVKEMYKMQVKI